MKIELEIDARDLAFAKVYADSIGMDTDSLIREILRDWALSVSEQITSEALLSLVGYVPNSDPSRLR